MIVYNIELFTCSSMAPFWWPWTERPQWCPPRRSTSRWRRSRDGWSWYFRIFWTKK